MLVPLFGWLACVNWDFMRPNRPRPTTVEGDLLSQIDFQLIRSLYRLLNRGDNNLQPVYNNIFHPPGDSILSSLSFPIWYAELLAILTIGLICVYLNFQSSHWKIGFIQIETELGYFPFSTKSKTEQSSKVWPTQASCQNLNFIHFSCWELEV